ncbi:MAG: ATP-binding protein [Candidatus Hadarchaeota archaeon]
MFNLVFWAYILAFGASAVTCFAVAARTDRIRDPDTRTGLLSLMVSSGGWAFAHVAYLLVPTETLKIVFYEIGLIIGLVAVGAWLYFCSAYTNRTLHRKRNLRWAAVAVFLVLVLIKVTNPVHHLYFTGELVNSPFYYLAIHNRGMHWLSMGLSYSLSMVGYFMLLEHFDRVSFSTKPLVFLVGITGAPLVLDIIGYSSPYLIDITYEPIGVAIFAVGVLFVFFDSFQTVQIAGVYDEPIILLDDQDRIHEYNESAQKIFPNLKSGETISKPVKDILPRLADVLESEESILEKKLNGNTRYYQISESPFSARQEQLGRVIVFTDITERKKAEKREEFLHSLLRHDLKNKLQISMGYGELLKETDLTDEQKEFIGKDWKAKQEALDLIEKVRKLQKAIDEELKKIEIGPILESTVEKYRSEASNRNMTITIEKSDVTVKGGSFLDELFSNLVLNSIIHSNGDRIRISTNQTDEKVIITVEDDGKGIPDKDKEKIFEKGFKDEETGGTGLGTYLVKEIAKSYGGSVKVKDSELGGARFDVELQKSAS